MTAPDISQPMEWLPLELVEKVLTYTSIRDILRIKLVNRGFNELIKTSEYIEYRVELFVAGLEDNPTSDVLLTKKRKDLAEYRARWDAFNPVKKPGRMINTSTRFNDQPSGSGVFCYPAAPGSSVQFVSLESIPRGIPQKEWEFLLPESGSSGEAAGLAICPQADVIAVVLPDISISEAGRKIFSYHYVHLRSMTTGQPHPGAKLTKLSWPKDNDLCLVRSTSITNSRFAMLVRKMSGNRDSDMCVWDWRTGEMILEKTRCGYYDLNFINEHSFVALSKSSLGLRCHVYDTECGTETEPTETIFSILGGRWFKRFSEPCGYAPSPDELTSSFYPDPSQRITVFDLAAAIYVINTELLLELARERRGQHFEWRQWSWATIEVKTGGLSGGVYSVCVSGCRMFCMSNGGQECCLQVYDFSHGGRAKNLKVLDEVGESERKRQMSSAIGPYRLPSSWDGHFGWDSILIAGHDSIVFRLGDTNPDPGPHSISTRMTYIWSV